MTHVVLIAGIEEWMAIIVPVASIAVYVLNQIFDKSGQQNQQPRRRVDLEREYQEIEKDEDDEVERMVREATERSRERQQAANRPAASRPQGDRAPRRDWASRNEVVEAEVVEEPRAARPRLSEARPAESRRPAPGQGVAAHVDKYLGEHERQFTKSVEATVSTEDIQSHLDEQVHAKFDHQVGSMDASTAAGDATTTRTAAISTGGLELSPILVLLSQPESFRQAFILQEIFDPPHNF